MCLDTVDKEIKVKEGIGWKAFLGYEDDTLSSICFHSHQPAGKWLRDDNRGHLQAGASFQRYPAGFHIHTNKKHAKEWCSDGVRRVKYRKVVATGRQMGANVIVAHEIRIFTAKEAKEYDK